jgi:murein DD-endopeptidase MepM/ murein hydrolase activator NlpD
MGPPSLPWLLLAASLAGGDQQVTRTVGSVTFRVDTRLARPGGLMVARLSSRVSLGAAYALLDGQRCPFYAAPGGPRALVPVAIGAAAGPTVLGVELWGRRGRQRIPLDVAIEPRDYPSSALTIPDAKLPLLSSPQALRDGRRLLGVLRTQTPARAWNGAFEPPVPGTPGGFGSVTTYLGAGRVESLTDSLYGERHRGLDYAVPAGTPVQAPAAGNVLLAERLALTGETLVLDHGQGVISAFYHLSRLDAVPGQRVERGAPLALTGETGIAWAPHLHWGVYVHGVAVDPRVFEDWRE